MNELEPLVIKTRETIAAREHGIEPRWNEPNFHGYKDTVRMAQSRLPDCKSNLASQDQAPNLKLLLECAIILSLAISEYVTGTGYETKLSGSMNVFEMVAPARFPILVTENNGFASEMDMVRWSEMFYFTGFSSSTVAADGTYFSAGSVINHDAAHAIAYDTRVKQHLRESGFQNRREVLSKYGVVFPDAYFGSGIPDKVPPEVLEFHRLQLSFNEQLVGRFQSIPSKGECSGVPAKNLVRLYFIIVHEGLYPGNLFHMMDIVASNEAYVSERFYENWLTFQAVFEVMDPYRKRTLNDPDVEKVFVSQVDPWEEAVEKVNVMFPEQESRKMIKCFVKLLKESCPTCQSGT